MAEDIERLLHGLTMAFTVLLSRQPNRAFHITADELSGFDYEKWELTTFEDHIDGGQIFCLVSRQHAQGGNN